MWSVWEQLNPWAMNKIEFLKLMNYPMEWLDWEMYPDELFIAQRDGYKSGHENGSEHDRHGAFQWCLKRNPSEDELIKLVKLSYLDAETGMGAYVRYYILKAEFCNDGIRELIGDDWIEA